MLILATDHQKCKAWTEEARKAGKAEDEGGISKRNGG
jgi:hypothetical protein